MSDYSNDVALMFPAKVFGGPEPNVDTHITVLYLGSKDDVPFTPDELVEVLKPLGTLDAGDAFARKFELFGENKDYLAVGLVDYHLNIIHSLVSAVVAQLGGKNASSFSDYSPHITLQEGFSGSLDNLELPSSITIGPLELWWGNEKIKLDKE